MLPLPVSENFALPISLGKITRTPYQIEKAVYTKEQAEEKAARQLKLYEKNLLGERIEFCVFLPCDFGVELIS